MGTALIYLLVVAAVAAVVFGLAAVVFGRGEELAPLPPGATPTRLPVGEVAGADVRALRIPQAVRGYRMDEVDWVLDRLADELDRAGAERDGLAARVAELESALGARGGTAGTGPASTAGSGPASTAGSGPASTAGDGSGRTAGAGSGSTADAVRDTAGAARGGVDRTGTGGA